MSKVNTKCGKCDKTVYPLEMIVACDKSWRKQCFRCTHCDNVISLKGFATIDSQPYCKPHYLELFKSKGTYKVFSGDTGASSSYNASAGFKGIEHVANKSGSGDSSPKVRTGSKIQVQIKANAGGSHLAHHETVDKSAPVIEKDVVIKKVDRTGFLSEVEGKHDLKKADVVDKSAPHIPAPVKSTDHSSLIKAVEGSETNLKHVDAVHDTSAPVIDKDVHVKKVDRKEILKAVEQPKALRDVDDFVRDRSAPNIDPEIKMKTSARPDVMKQIATGPEKPLTTPNAHSDSSAPKTGHQSSSKCATCGKTVYDLEMLRACEKSYHKQCFRCKKCDNVVSLKGFAMIDGDPYCKPHYLEIFKSKGNYATFKEGDEQKSSSYNASKGFKGY